MRAVAAFMLSLVFGACLLQVEGPSGDKEPLGAADAAPESASSVPDAAARDARPTGSADAAPPVTECAAGDGLCPEGCDVASDGDCGPSCDELYGGAPGYLLCSEEAMTCTFAATTSGGTCNEMCASLGGTCVDAIDNVEPDLCADAGQPDDCATARQTEICVCTRPGVSSI